MNTELLSHIDDLESYVKSLSPQEKLVVLNYLKQVENYKKYNKLNYFKGDVWQVNAITLGFKERYRGVIAGNR